MARMEKFKIEVGSGSVSGVMHLPHDGESSEPLPAVMICQGVHLPGEDASEFLDAICQSLATSGVTAVRFEHRCSELILEDFDVHSAEDDLEDVLAIHNWLIQQPGIDRVRVGVVGYSLGAIAATALCRRLESINRLCLLSAATAKYLRDRFGSEVSDGNQEQMARLPASYLPSLEEIDSPREAAYFNRPTLVLHGAADRVIPPTVSLDYVRALELAGRTVEHILVSRGDHTFARPAARAACVSRLLPFLAGMEVVASAST